jgi:DNA-binding MarR family transcriptional regulator
MANTISTAGPSEATHGEESSRLLAVTELLGQVLDPGAELDRQELIFDAATRTVIDAVIAGERRTLDGLLDELRAAQARFTVVADPTPVQSEVLGRLRGLLAVAFAAVERLLDPATLAEVGVGTYAHRFLLALSETRSLSGGQLAEQLNTDASEVSRNGRTLMTRGLVTRSKAGRHVYWEITRRGQRVLQGVTERQKQLDSPRRSAELMLRTHGYTDVETRAAGGSRTGPSFGVGASGTHRRVTSGLLARELMDHWLLDRRDEVENRLRVWGSLNQFACGPLHWNPPLQPEPRQTSRDLLASKLDLMGVAGVEQFWPAQLPAWDAFAIADGPDSRQGLVLFEAKLRPDEFRAGQVRLKNRQRISTLRQALVDTKTYLNVSHNADWSHAYPDAANRLAFLYFLRERASLPTWVVQIFFVRDPHSDPLPHDPPHSEEEWREHLRHVQTTLRLAAEHPLSPFVREEFLPARTNAPDLTTTMETRMPKANDTDRYVVPNSERGGWDVVKEEHERASAHVRTKNEAIGRAREITRNQGGGEVRIANRHGQFIDSDTQSGPKQRESKARDRK